jgi:hypothetical protein
VAQSHSNLRQFDENLSLDTCPQCGVARPLLPRIWQTFDQPGLDRNLKRSYALYVCTNCKELILTVAAGAYDPITDIWPEPQTLPSEIPPRAEKALADPIKTRTLAPSLSILACSRALDFMLREKNITGQSLNEQIESAGKQHILISGMIDWAHEIRLAANLERHPDQDDATPEEVQQCLDFAFAVAQNLFVLPAKVTLGKQRAKRGRSPPSTKP